MAGNQPEAVARWRVVAGVDGSPNSLLALRRAVYAARLCGACADQRMAPRPAGDTRPRAMARARRP